MALDEVEETLYEVEEDQDDFGDTFPLVLEHVGLGEGLLDLPCLHELCEAAEAVELGT